MAVCDRHGQVCKEALPTLCILVCVSIIGTRGCERLGILSSFHDIDCQVPSFTWSPSSAFH
eukprot:scaffold95883_cov35-Tisochrysis_lutea.AAC.1